MNAIGNKRLYVSGKITGTKNENREKFNRAVVALEKSGYVAIIPHWFTEPHHDWSTAMKRSIEAMFRCHGVATLDDWKNSKGAKIECKLAEDLEIPVHTVYEWVKLSRVNDGNAY